MKQTIITLKLLMLLLAAALSNTLQGQPVAGGLSHSLALNCDGTVSAWGDNSFDELGNGTTTSSSTPVQVSGLTGVVGVAAGAEASYALKSDGTVWAWGYNHYGELGNGTTTKSSIPVQVVGPGNVGFLTSIIAISANNIGYSCLALRSDGTVWAWGFNNDGQLGNGTTTNSATPVQVSSITNATAIAAGYEHSLALLSTGAVEAWGDNSTGQLGNGTTTNSSTPVAVSGITTATAIAAGDAHSIALLSTGAVQAWGDNFYGQLGNGTATNSSTPVAVSGITNATAIAAGYEHSLALLSTGAVKAWGYNGYGQLGNGTKTNSSTPVSVSGISTATAIAAGYEHSLALLSTGAVQAWGYNMFGQLGNGTITSSSTPVAVSVTHTSAATITETQTGTVCSGGSIKLASSAASFYKWSPGGQTTDSIVVSSPGTYSLVTGCAGTPAAPVVVNPCPTLSVTNTPQTYTASPIAATVSGMGGGAVSNILYNGSATIPTNAGTYAITANIAASANYSAATGASAGNFVISPAPLAITANNITKCSGATYTFAGTEFSTIGLKNGDAVNSVTLTSAGAAASATTGVYSITPSAAVGTGLSNYNISYNIGLMTVETLSLTITQVNPDCYGDPGSLSGSVSGGTAPYMYEVNSGLTYLAGPVVYGPSTTPLYSPVTPGYYTYSVTDAAGCMAIAPRLSVNYLTKTTVLEGTTTAPATTQICYGGTKTINTTPIGGATPYTYSLNTNGVSGPFVQSSLRYFNVAAGTYYITVKDNVGCRYVTDTISITQPAAGVSFTTSIGGQACATLGGISVSASGGYGGYSYSDNGGSSYQKSDMFMGLAYGNYTVAVEDTNGCAATREVVKFAPLTSSAITAAANPICTGATTNINTVPSGGTAPYSYSLDGLAYVPSNARYFNVTAGTHTITVKDNVSCTYGPLSITITSTSCSGLAEGGEELQKVQPSGAMFEAHLSPNPTMASFHLQLQSSSREDVQLVVTNILGVKVYEAKGSIDNAYEFGAAFKNGIYILQILQGNTVHTLKLVKGN